MGRFSAHLFIIHLKEYISDNVIEGPFVDRLSVYLYFFNENTIAQIVFVAFLYGYTLRCGAERLFALFQNKSANQNQMKSCSLLAIFSSFYRGYINISFN